MIIKLEKVISCTSEDPKYPASNLLQQRSNSSWRCAKPGELMASVILKLAEPSCITALDIGNYRCCIVVVTASTNAEPDNWHPIVNHRFMTHDEAINGQFKDQVALFLEKELNSDTVKIKFDRVKVSCMQSANLRETFGLAFLILRTKVVVQLGNDIFERFKLKTAQEEFTLENFKEKRLKLLSEKQPVNYKENLAIKIQEEREKKFAQKQANCESDKVCPRKTKTEEEVDSSNRVAGGPRVWSMSPAPIASNPVRRTPFGDLVKTDIAPVNMNAVLSSRKTDPTLSMNNKKKRRTIDNEDSSEEDEKRENRITPKRKKEDCSVCTGDSRNDDKICDNCKELQQKPRTKLGNQSTDDSRVKKKIKLVQKKEFSKLFEDVRFSLSGYVNPQRDEIRRKALKMGGKYIVDPNTSNNKCTHLICAFKNTPKSQQLKDHAKIVSHKFIDDCYDKKKRLPWRRFAMDRDEKSKSESEDEIEGSTTPAGPSNPYQRDTDSDSDY